MIVALLFLLSLFLFPQPIHAADKNFVTPVFPIRGREYWREGGDLKHFSNLKKIVLDTQLPATWLLHYDVLRDKEIIDRLKELPTNQEIGLFLEVTRQLAEDSFVVFDWENDHWSSAHKLFLSGYILADRQKIIDNAFNSFKETFGYYPKSYGSWYTDVYSSNYIKQKYSAQIQLGLADQYSTDGYQTWGQYINQPYFVSKKSAIEPAQDEADSTGILKVLWAPREPTASFGDTVEFSNFSLQLNDYSRSKKLPHQYFSTLLKDLTLDVIGPISQVVVGLEVAEVSDQYLPELNNQLQTIKRLQGESLQVTVLSDFDQKYRQQFPHTSPALLLNSTTEKSTSYWYMSPYYRLGLFIENDQVILKDLRYYHQNYWHDNDQSQIDPRHNLSRVVPASIDQVVYGNQTILGKNKDFRIEKIDDLTRVFFDNQELVLTDKFPVFPTKSLPEKKIDTKTPQSISRCFDQTGGFSPPYSCLKQFFLNLTSYIPDLRYSSLHGQKYLGLATGPETLIGLRFPALKIGRHQFDFPILENFISLRKKLTPQYSWFGKQEFEVQQIFGCQIDKAADYGQDNLIKFAPDTKAFENGYYLVLKTPCPEK